MRTPSAVIAVLSAAGMTFSATVVADHPSLTVPGGPAGPITTLAAGVVPVGTWATGLRAEYIDFDAFSDAELLGFAAADDEADVHSVGSLTSLSAGAAYGLTENLTLGVSLPYISREDIRQVHGNHGGADQAPEAERLGNASGIGDAVLSGRYRLFASEDAHRQASVVFGIKTPTGKTSARAPDGERLEVDLQPGSGSWDPLLGAALSWGTGRVGLNASLLYKFSTQGSQDTELGDVVACNAALTYRVTGGEETGDHHHEGREPHGDHHHAALGLVLELNDEWRGKDRTDGSRDPNSGGNVLYLSPGVNLGLAGNWSASLSLGFPVATDLNGIQTEPDRRIIAGASASF